MKMYLARNRNNKLMLFRWMPEYNAQLDMWFEEHLEDGYGNIYDDECPEVTFENSPMEVEIKIKKNGLHFSPMLRLLGMIINKDPSDRKRIEGYTKKLIDNLKEEGFDDDARVAEDYLKALNGEPVGMATMDEVELKLDRE